MINWPCFFKLEGDDELIYLGSESDLMDECQSLIWSDADVIVDSDGQQFTFALSKNHTFCFQMKGDPLTLEVVTALIQAHEFSKAEMCLTKIQFRAIDDAIESLSF
ncbi:DUF4144 family protein [Photobacterium sp. GB-1]|uniref:DUF4144 family protein n=1 Tax=Photobacterium sp. GB-1 TaxID=2022111 RepID=UPI000D15DD9E|nr:DUF4144 family protein [Photobacterium sp. GB-1]PSV54190.1 hypothetical protein C9J45_05355 [Photobacterium sp. GB-1]